MRPANRPQRRHPPFLNHTPRGFEREDRSSFSSTFWHEDFYVDPLCGRVNGQLERQTRPRRSFCSSVSSASDIRTAISRREYRRRHSWKPTLSNHEPVCYYYSLSKSTAGRTLVSSSTMDDFLRLPKDNASFDMAYFLKHTGPPRDAEPESPVRKLKHKSAFRFFRSASRRGLGSRTTSAASNYGDSRRNTLISNSGKPSDAVLQKTSVTGKKYLQIITNDQETLEKNALREFRRRSTERNQRYRTSAHYSPVPIGTEEFDTWIKSQNEDLEVRKIKALDVKQKPIVNHTELIVPHKAVTGKASDITINDKEICVTTTTTALQKETTVAAVVIDTKPTREYIGTATTVHTALSSNPPDSVSTIAALENRLHPPQPSDHADISETPIMRPEADLRPQPPPKPDSLISPESSAGQTTASMSDFPTPPASISPSEPHTRTDSVIPKLNTTKDLPPTRQPSTRAPSPTISHRADKTRARKLRDLQRPAPSIDELLHTRHLQNESKPHPHPPTPHPITVSPATTSSTGLYSQLSPPPPVPSAPFIGGTGYTPSSGGTMALSPIMLVAESVPVVRGRNVRRPARLVLKRNSRPIAIAIRPEHTPPVSGDETSEGSVDVDVDVDEITVIGRGNDASGMGMGVGAGVNPPLSLTHGPGPAVSPLELPPKREHFVPSSTRRPPHLPLPLYPPSVPAKSTQRKPVATAGYPVPRVLRGEGVHALPHLAHRVQVTEGKELEKRVEALERENKLLETALLAVLKASARMGGCPCLVRFEGEERGERGLREWVGRCAGREREDVREVGEIRVREGLVGEGGVEGGLI
ncbi:hypothetical protein M501DRAFT_1057198 [Patellaria atrata CBS 101060]|uniref:Uncharacterized protein n=1 Tax=Patellaria atrata CBS 101060 TaxID=1346257 RepID=A0A9P4VTT0_9PEZI|nr:hypothetical protein M501DRAFT_1057198 [Patellaria atrata CBS 101060]